MLCTCARVLCSLGSQCANYADVQALERGAAQPARRCNTVGPPHERQGQGGEAVPFVHGVILFVRCHEDEYVRRPPCAWFQCMHAIWRVSACAQSRMRHAHVHAQHKQVRCSAGLHVILRVDACPLHRTTHAVDPACFLGSASQRPTFVRCARSCQCWWAACHCPGARLR